ncbi:MAG: type II secretion system protein GspC [Myxococcota bacterium]
MSRTFPIVILFIATLLGGGGGYLTNAVLRYLVALPDGAVLEKPDAGLVADAGPDRKGPTTPAAVRGPTERQYLEKLLCRNLFDVAKVGECDFGEKKDPNADTEAFTDLKVTLLGTLVATPAQYSSALILKDGEDRAEGYSIDDKIGDAVIVAIESKLVRLRRGTAEEILTMDEDAEDRPRAAASTDSDEKGGGDDEVTDLGDNNYAIDRSTLDKYLSDLEGISRMGRALLHRGPDGEFDGYRLSAIRRNTIADKLGIRNGDIIHSVNGKPLNSMQSAMEAFNTMQNDANFKFEVTRRGQKVELGYEVR